MTRAVNYYARAHTGRYDAVSSRCFRCACDAFFTKHASVIGVAAALHCVPKERAESLVRALYFIWAFTIDKFDSTLVALPLVAFARAVHFMTWLTSFTVRLAVVLRTDTLKLLTHQTAFSFPLAL